MLQCLRIENFALIDQLELNFTAGLNVLTGETGAGKSIILDAIDILLGGKITSRLIRTGAERALLEASFSLDPPLVEWLAGENIDPLEGNLLVCSREIAQAQGNLRSRSRLNGVLVNKQQIERLRDRLIEITAQGQAVLLGHSGVQREWLDGFGGEPILQQRLQVASRFSTYQRAHQALEEYRQTERQRLQQLDVLEYQLRELQQADLSCPEELEQLVEEEQRLSHSLELQQQSYQVYQALYENDQGQACADLLGTATAILGEMSGYDSQIQPIFDLVQDALAQVEEAGRQIHLYGEQLESDPQCLVEVQDRLMALKQLCRKYGPTLAEAIAHRDRIDAELAQLTAGEQLLETLEQQLQTAELELQRACASLTQQRQTFARALEVQLINQLRPLAMEKVQFQVALQPIPPTAQGSDAIRFLFSSNPGEPLQPLAQTASGGEMSRLLLALKACFSQVDPVATLIFDEIDVGVSGRVAQAIAEKLHQLSRHHQVFCVTHQPIVAALADRHFRVEKQVLDQAEARTVVRVSLLDNWQRRQELAQLAGGRSAEDALTLAEALLNQAAALRQGQPTPLPQANPSKSRRGKAKTSTPA